MWPKLNLFYSPDEPAGTGGGGDFLAAAMEDLGDFDSTEGAPSGEGDDDLDVKAGDAGSKDDVTDDDDDIDDDKPIRNAETVGDKDDDTDEKDDKKVGDDKDKKQDDKDKQPETIEAKDLTPRALKESYPKIFKEFPELKDVIFQNREYNKVFGSVEDATEAREKAETFDQIAQTTLRGDPTELINALEKTGKGHVEQFSTNLIAQLRSDNPDMYYRVTDPILAMALKAAETHANKSGDKNLVLATKYISQFVFGDQNIPVFNGSKRKEADPERIEFERQKQVEAETRYAEHQKTIYDYTEKKLDLMIREGLDPDNVYNNFVREALADKVMARIGQSLKADKAFQGQMSALWKRANKEGFTRESKQRIAHTYLAKAKRIMPAIRSKIRGEAKADGSGNSGNRNNEQKRQITSSGSGSGQGKKVIPNDPKKIDWSKVSDEDILNSP